ncbi:MAG: hypothetical protein HOO67_06245 [Candidatus Peribacteraceae bacterium]|nr:hypothetical protein [Candidatus Peribacteraceae bacterium]
MVLMLALGLLAGCAGVRQKWTDYWSGKHQATEPEKAHIKADAQSKADLARNIPVVGQYAATALLVLLPIFGFANLGRSRRLGESTAEKPYMGHLGDSVPWLEKSVQVLTDVNRGVMEIVGGKGSPLQRGYKVFVAILVAVIPALMAEPRFLEWIKLHPVAALIFGAIAPIVAGLSKKLDEVKLTPEMKAASLLPPAAP